MLEGRTDVYDRAARNPAAVRPSDHRPSLADRRRDALRLDIAREAVRLFAAQGVTPTTGEEIAQSVGISARTLWRHFPNKESCIRPLLTAGLEVAIDHLHHWPRETGLVDYLTATCRQGNFAPPDAAVLHLIRMTRTEPALRAVWLQAHDDALPVFTELLARRAGKPSDDLRVKVHAATINGALRAAAEDFALHCTDDDADTSQSTLAASLHVALEAAAGGLPY
ncbi:TetR family transcriptional regulator [Streptomyces sp. HNM0575]|nr:TetR/AcrR family transcriptional regulator [Streptomyces sp. HNM0575]NLU75302.1 TetR family transcriptional regulator [Streptomyces sp. HNM0575]